MTSQDARGNTATYSYDSLNRLLSVAYVSAGNAAASNMDTNPNVTLNYRYDGNPNPVNNAKGKLSHIDDPTGATDWVYDSEGRVQSKTQTQGNISKALSYGYDTTTGRLLTITYPSGMVVQYSYDSTGRPSSLAVKKPTGANFNTLIGSISYRPLGPISSYQLTGVTGTPTITRSYDSDGRMTGYSLINATKQLSYDRLGNVKTWGNGDANDQTYTYDALNRLTDTIIPNTSKVHYDYDTNGNRTHAYTYIPPTSTTATSSTTYNIGSTSNLVTNNSYKYDLSGNLISSNAASPTAVNTYGYDSRNRFVALSVVNPSTQPKTQTFTYRYGINALGQRVSKTNIVAATGNIYLYDEAGHLVGEYDQTGALQQEHIWLGDQPVAVANSAQALFHVLSDHLNTPRQIVNTSGVVRWQWDSTDPFGNNAPNPNPTGTAANFTYNLRFPGQYYDGETGLFYNYYRTYDPKTGRYTQSDPIGLKGGLNTFGYVGGNPIKLIDPLGLHSSTGESHNPLGTLGSASEWIYNQVCPNDDNKDCSAIRSEIDALTDELEKRYEELLIDRYNLFGDHKRLNEANPYYGSWEGHIQKYLEVQLHLRLAIAMAQAKGCSYNDEANNWTHEPPPSEPWGY
ncbi:RHS repeat-associated core domain-containing protein [Methylovulum psychrotolerans]|uniref:RHS repeat protein n=1 Tax=Methylovulum psychrotolerans TaxID=1704499 RepID=A0A2S5CGA5_9GAMM|nr:RHS repeat-associated core domain-containing protein [Methylovulum psychrotolerans]POZ49840.1 RHS repeat protein [Methylovulum psychrotolerans]